MSEIAREYWQNMASRYAGSLSDVDWREMEETNRWDGFSGEELVELMAGAINRRDGSKAVPAEYRERAGRLATKLRKVLKARDNERPTYRGPGRYRHISGEIYEVLGAAYGGADDPRVVIVRHSSGEYYYEGEENFEKPIDGQRRYEYLGPLEDKNRRDHTTAPADTKILDAGQGWVMLRLWNGQDIRLDVGDTFTVPTSVFS